MDHTPGQRQWSNMAKWRKFNQKRFGDDDAAAMKFYDHRQEMQRLYSEPHRRAIVEACKQRELPMASHDDTTVEHVEEAANEGISISEFPTTVEAARSARDKGMKNVMGAPNVVQGGSHSGNASATDLAQQDLVDGLASDYVPISLLHGAFMLAQETDMTLPQSIATVTSGPADMIGFHDRGEIAPGKRADLVRVREWHHMPMIRDIWCGQS
jgi:alpha-D-ribose 1-methylphosphonate 5-triphosphate diphosphatase